jgi:hypothetical protein
MFEEVWTDKRRRVAEEEDLNRDGHWVRDFSVRGESWPLIEHWAAERGFRLTAIKGRRRTYQKGFDPGFYQTVIEIRHEERRVVLSAHIKVGLKLRLMTLFFLPSELQIEATGFRGIRTRRTACNDLNILLTRLRQPQIFQSDKFHLLEMDMTTLLLGSFLIAPLVALPLALAYKFEIKAGLSNPLLALLAEKAGTLAGIALALLIFHHWAIVKRLEKAFWKMGSLTIFSVTFLALSIFTFTRTRTEMLEARIIHHCVLHFSSEKCGSRMSELTETQRDTLSRQIEAFHKHLSFSDKSKR